MYGLLSLLIGVMVATMIPLNGALTETFGAYTATVVIHLCGGAVIAAVVALRRERPFAARHPWPLYLGGAIGSLTTVFNNMAFGRISVSAILALGLLGQSLTGLVIDQTGWMGVPVRKLRKSRLIGLALAGCGIACMLTSFVLWPVVLSLLTGVTVVTSRTLNARLSARTSIWTGTLFNYLTGLCVAVPLLLFFGRGEPAFTAKLALPAAWYFLGGPIGVATVALSSVAVEKISAVGMTLFLFVGQVFAGIALDALLTGAFSAENLIGGLFVAAGLTVNVLLDRRDTQKTASPEEEAV